MKKIKKILPKVFKNKNKKELEEVVQGLTELVQNQEVEKETLHFNSSVSQQQLFALYELISSVNIDGETKEQKELFDSLCELTNRDVNGERYSDILASLDDDQMTDLTKKLLELNHITPS